MLHRLAAAKCAKNSGHYLSLGTALSTVAGWALAGYRVGFGFSGSVALLTGIAGVGGLRVRRCQRHTRQRWHGPQVSGGKTLRASQQAQPPPVGQPTLPGGLMPQKLRAAIMPQR